MDSWKSKFKGGETNDNGSTDYRSIAEKYKRELDGL